MIFCHSKDDARIEVQERYVTRRMKDGDMIYLKKLRDTFFNPGADKYSDNQIKGYLRQEYNHTRHSDDYVLDSDLRAARQYRHR